MTKTIEKANHRMHGFTLIELMIVIAIIGILAAIAAPQYNNYTKQSRFSEVVLATSAFKTPAEIAYQSGRATALSDLNNDINGIPSVVNSTNAVGKYVAGVTMVNGTIKATGTSEVNNATYTIDASFLNGGIRWKVNDTATDSCQAIGIC